MRSFSQSHANRIRQRASTSEFHGRRRTAGRLGRQVRRAVCRAGRKTACYLYGGSRNRSQRSLRNECGKALQVGTSRKAATARETKSRGSKRLPSMARQRDESDKSATDRLPDRGPGVIGPHFRVIRSRGVIQSVADYPPVLATVHPSSILRARTSEDREKKKKEFVADLVAADRAVAKLESLSGASSERRK